MKKNFDKKYLLITSDDFGMTHSVNQGILEGFTRGLLKCSNFMVPCPWFHEALKLTEEYNLPIGVHLNITCEWSNYKWGPLTKAPSLVDRNGHFLPDYPYLQGKYKKEEVVGEYRAQLDRVFGLGVKPTHIDSHMLPALTYDADILSQEFANIVKEIADEYGLYYIYEAKDKNLVYFTNEFHISGTTYSEITAKLENLENGIYHLISHLATSSDEQKSLSGYLEEVYPWASFFRENDMNIITSSRFRDYLEEKEFELIDIAGLKKLHGDA